jgi:plasmid stability protein
MVSFTIKGIPEDLYALLKQRAGEHRRSINSEVLVCLEESLKGRRVDSARMLARADAVRERLGMPEYTQAALNAAKNRGRR